jgi:glycosyltransferase involved in cell wall biosynthesis
MKTKILLLLYEPHHSGQGVHVLGLAGGLDRDKYEIQAVCPDSNVETIAGLERCGVATMPLAMRKVRNVGPAWHLFRAIRQFQPHIFHVHSLEAGVWSRPVAAMAGVPAIVYTPQTIAIRQKRWQGAYETWERLLAPLTDRWIAVSEGQRQQLIAKKIASVDKAVTIYNGIDPAPFARPVDVGQKRSELGIPPSHAVVT